MIRYNKKATSPSYFDEPILPDSQDEALLEDYSKFHDIWNRLNNLYGPILRNLDDLFIDTQNQILIHQKQDKQEYLKEIQNNIISIISVMEWELFQFAEYTKPNLANPKLAQSMIELYQKNIAKIRNTFPFMFPLFSEIEASPYQLLAETNIALPEDLLQLDLTQLKKVKDLEAYDKRLSEALKMIHARNQQEENYVLSLKLYHLSEFLFSKRQKIRDKIYKIKFTEMDKTILADTIGYSLKDACQAYIKRYNDNLDKMYMSRKGTPNYLSANYFNILIKRFDKIIALLIQGEHAQVILELLEALEENSVGVNLLTAKEIRRHSEARLQEIIKQLEVMLNSKTNYLNLLDLSDNLLVDIKYLDKERTKPMINDDTWFNLLLAKYLHDQGYFVLIELKNALKRGDFQSAQQIIQEKGASVKIISAKKAIDIIAQAINLGQLLMDLYLNFTPANQQQLFTKIDELQAWMEKMDIQGLAAIDIIRQLPISEPLKDIGFWALSEIIFKNKNADKSVLKDAISFYFSLRKMPTMEAIQTLRKMLSDKNSIVVQFLEANPTLFPGWQRQRNFYQDIHNCNQALTVATLENDIDKRREIRIKVAILLLSQKELLQYSFLSSEHLSSPIKDIINVLEMEQGSVIVGTFETIVHLLDNKNYGKATKIIQTFNQEHSDLFEQLARLGDLFEINIKDYLKAVKPPSPLSRLASYKPTSLKKEKEEERLTVVRKELVNYIHAEDMPLSIVIPSRSESSNSQSPHSIRSDPSSSIDSPRSEIEVDSPVGFSPTEDTDFDFPEPQRLWHLIDNDYQALYELYERMNDFGSALENQSNPVSLISLMEYELNSFKKYTMPILQNQQRVKNYVGKCQGRITEIKDYFSLPESQENPFEFLTPNINQITTNFATLTVVEIQSAKLGKKETVNLQKTIQQEQNIIAKMILAQSGDYSFNPGVIIFDPVLFVEQMEYGQESAFIKKLEAYEQQLSKELADLYVAYQKNKGENISYLIYLKNIYDFLLTKQQATREAIHKIKTQSLQQGISYHLNAAKQEYIDKYNDTLAGYIGDLSLLSEDYFDILAKTFETKIVVPLVNGQSKDAMVASLQLFAREGISGISGHFTLRAKMISEQLAKIFINKSYLNILDIPDNLLVDSQFLKKDISNSDLNYDNWFNIMLSQYLYNQGYFVLLDLKNALMSGNLDLAQEIIHNKANSITFPLAKKTIDFIDKTISLYKLLSDVYINFTPEKEKTLFAAITALQDWFENMGVDDIGVDFIKQLPISEKMKNIGLFAILEIMIKGARPEKSLFKDALSFYFALRQMDPLSGIKYLRSKLDEENNEVIQYLDANPNLFPGWQKLLDFYDDLSNCIQAMTIAQQKVDSSLKLGNKAKKEQQQAINERWQMGLQTAILIISHANTLQSYADSLVPEEFISPIDLIISALKHKHAPIILSTFEQIILLANVGSTSAYLQIAKVIKDFKREHGLEILEQLAEKLGINLNAGVTQVAFHVAATVSSKPEFSDPEARAQYTPLARSKIEDYIMQRSEPVNSPLSIHSSSVSKDSPTSSSTVSPPQSTKSSKTLRWSKSSATSPSSPDSVSSRSTPKPAQHKRMPQNPAKK